MAKRGVIGLTAFCAVLVAVNVSPQSSSQTASTGAPMATVDRVQLSGWWPTKGAPARAEYAGPAACVRCHAEKAATQKDTPMAHASMEAANSDILRSHPQLNLKIGPYSYEMARHQEGSVYSVSDGRQSLSAVLAWAFGVGEVGQTYIYQRNGNFYESRLSFYKNTQALDFSPGHPRSVPLDLENALGRQVYASEARLCFGCHTTAATTGNRFDPEHLIPGVTCEACHGPGAEHVVAMTTSQDEPGPTLIMNPRRLKPVESVEFCGACHRTAWDVALAGSKGIYNIRFQPYRLETSRCWGNGDARLTCITCHDPHQPLVRDAAAYDQRCMACHLSGAKSKPTHERPGAVCPVSTKDCVTCHMPKYEIPGMHAKFTDHRIRIAKKDAEFAD
jgi:hypothetical protein